MAAAAARTEATEEGWEPGSMPASIVVKKVRLEEPLLPQNSLGTASTSTKSSRSSARMSRSLRLPWSCARTPGRPSILKGSGGSSSSGGRSSASGADGGGGSSSSSAAPRRSSIILVGQDEAKRYFDRVAGWVGGHNPVNSQRTRQLLNRWQKRRGSDSDIRRLDSSQVRDAFQEKRLQVLTGDQHNLDVLGPYAKLHLHIKEARHLLPLDSNGASDPYVEVFVNDVHKGRSAHVHKTVDPKWDFEIDLDIWSPFTIVRLAVMDWDRFSKDDYIGFVEFRIAEVEPNGPEVSGWCELRLEEMLEGTATHRFRRHQVLRDDHELFRSGDECTRCISVSSRHAAMISASTDPMQLKESLRALSPHHADAFLDPVVSAPDSGRRRFGLTRMKALCCATGSKEPCKDADVDVPRDCFGKRLNGGEIHLSMRLETVADPSDELGAVKKAKPHPSLGWILLSSVIRPSWLLDICQDEEWYACCFPHPEFESAQDNKESFSLQDVKEFYDDAMELKAVLQSCITWPLMSIFLYVVCWRDLALSSLTMAYWLAVCMWPFHLLPTMPLFCAYWLHLLRDRSRRNDFFAHEATAPLTEEGLAMVAALRSSKRMQTWLRRLVKDRGGWVDKMASLKMFARLTHKDGRPTLSFDHLVEDLMARPWVQKKVLREKRCKEGHILQLLGRGIYQPANDGGWYCSGPVGRPAADCEASICDEGLHLGVRRYRCPSCCVDFCGLCAAGGRALPQVMKFDPARLPMGGSAMVRTVRDFVLENQDAVDDIQELLEGFLKVVERLLDEEDLGLAFHVYACLGVLSAVLLGAVLLVHGALGFILYWACTIFWMIVGSAFMVQGAMPIRRLRTAYRASRDFAKCRELRQKGGCERWAFFTPDIHYCTTE